MNEEQRKKIEKLLEEEKYNEIIELYNKALEENRNEYKSYHYRVIVRGHLGEHKEAIKDYNKAIKLNPHYSNAYNNRGLAKYNLDLYEEAIKDFDKAIKINANYIEAYNNRGITRGFLELNEEAIEDFNKVIELNPDDSEIYYNRGTIKWRLKLYEEAIKDFNKAIEINLNDSKVYNNRGITKICLYLYKEAIEDLSKAIELNKKIESNIIYSLILNLYKDNKINIYDINNEYRFIEYDSLYKYILENNNNINDEIKKNIKDILLFEYLLLCILAVRDEEITINHHTSLHNLLNIIKNNNNDKNNNYIRISPITTANDPEEGKVLEKILKNNNCNININSDNNLITFQTSFTKNKDSLNMFRLYGRDIKTNEEATGVSIVINKEYFNFDYSTTLPPLEPICMNSNFNKTEQNNYNKSINNKRDLYWVLYYNKETNQLIYNPNKSKYEHTIIDLNDKNIKDDKSTPELIKYIFLEIVKNAEELDSHINKLENTKEMKEAIYSTLFENIRYIIKDEAFYEEQELRILCTTTPDNKTIEVDKNIDKLYIKYIPLFDKYVEEIILGSKIKDKEAVKDYLQALLNEKYPENKIKISISKAPLR